MDEALIGTLERERARVADELATVRAEVDVLRRRESDLVRQASAIDRSIRLLLKAARPVVPRPRRSADAAPSPQSAGGHARKAAMTAEARSEVSRKAANARWGRRGTTSPTVT